ncbi:MAG: ABC transporter ATP-binding protein [Clostridiales bacterium]|nr:ABC transporter ATP-binding protein [Clostridiales bacterium]
MVSLQNVSSGYNGQEIIKDASISFEKGTITTIIGKNGSGKTTLLRTASGLLKALSGKVLLNGRNIKEHSSNEIARQISFLPQTRITPEISVYNLVMHGRFPYMGFTRISQEKDKKAVEDALAKMGLAEYRDRNIQTLSGGERQKAYLAMVLAQDTDIIFLDEAITYLDINHQFEILNIILQLKKMGKTLVMVLHDLNSALTYSDRICLMDKGRIILYASSEKIVESRELERVFHVNCCPVAMDGESTQYVFTLKKD